MLKFAFGEPLGGRAALGLLIIRLIAGAGMMQHGWGKIQHPFSWMGPASPVPGILQALAAVSEFGGGLALIIGLLTPLAMLGWVCTMLYAILMVHLPKGDPFVAKPGGSSYELAALYLGIAFLLLFTGPGALSIDAKLFGRQR